MTRYSIVSESKSSIGKILKNALWLIVQPLILNLISIAVTGYIARKLGADDFGKFNFAFLSFVPMFICITGLGLSSVAIRDISRDKSDVAGYMGKILSVRLIISLMSWILCSIIIVALGHPLKTQIVVWIAGAMILAQAITRTYEDLASAYEKMKTIALRDFWSGLILTGLSVLILITGGRIYRLSLVYIFGSLIAVFLSLYYAKKFFVLPKLGWNTKFIVESIKKGFFFYLAGVVILVSDKIDITILSQVTVIKKIGEESVGYYTSAMIILTKLWIIPNALQAALYPTLSAAWGRKKEEACLIMKQFFTLTLLVGLPMSAGLQIIAAPVMQIIFGHNYDDGIIILSWGSWLIFFWCINLIMGIALGAANKEKTAFWINLAGLIVTVGLSIPLSYMFLHKGTLIARLSGQLIILILFIAAGATTFKNMIDFKAVIKIIFVTILMAIFTYMTNKINFVLALFTGVTVYGILAYFLNIVNPSDVKKLFFPQ